MKSWLLILSTRHFLTTDHPDFKSFLPDLLLVLAILLTILPDFAMAFVIIQWKPTRRWIWPWPLLIAIPVNLFFALSCTVMFQMAGAMPSSAAWAIFPNIAFGVLFAVFSCALCIRADKNSRQYQVHSTILPPPIQELPHA
jgi:hypothetical protein